MGPESVWRGRDPETAAPGIISFLEFLSRPQTAGGPKWGRVAWGKASGLWPCPSLCPSLWAQDWLSSWLVPISSAERVTRLRGHTTPHCRGLQSASAGLRERMALACICFQDVSGTLLYFSTLWGGQWRSAPGSHPWASQKPGQYAAHTHMCVHTCAHFCGPPSPLPMSAFPFPGREAGGDTGPGHPAHGKDADITGPASHLVLTPGTEGCSVLGWLCHLQPLTAL